MRKQFFYIALMLCLPIMAAERSEQQILEAAARVLSGRPLARSVSGNGPETFLHIVQRRAAVTVVGAEGGGFALVSNDVSQRPVLGYSHEGNFDPEGDMPCGLKWYLDALDESLSELYPSRAAILPGADVKPFVEPLIETDWYQTAPFYDWLPTYTDKNGKQRHFYTGCGHTAAAQLMYYYKYPDKPHGQIAYSYDPFEDGHPVEMSCNLDTVTFDWDHIAPIYNNRHSANERENEEVARLFLAICNAWHAQYKPDGANNGVPYIYPFYDNFGYSRDCRRIPRDNYNDELWMSIIFDELSNGHPIIYRGETADHTIGHGFILDGYDADGLVHVNWGHGRLQGHDGYFSIDLLKANNYDRDYSTLQAMWNYIRPKSQPLSATSLTVSEPGTLASLLAADPLKTRFKISGHLNGEDLKVLKQRGQQVRGSDSLVCAELTHLDLSEAILPGDMLPESAFEDCTALLSVVLPASLKYVAGRAFSGCSRLAHVGMPSGLRSIGDFAFLSCINLTDIVIPRDVETIGTAACTHFHITMRFTMSKYHTNNA